ncbi:hypothetical protein HN018_26305 (plasmid) [Lichenicola cladoniae]|uniref:Alpha/beta hydrolase n=1 Tax=Lichenicola cladoniae TaxID=1484109 RepID=A0A6M8I027_9PROT|nr:hypothetical protein [Lichenicola cladoniae]NPD69349.1 hypothetical protein [Acetobacteraceae bacterium]QKE93661.1 hypothetical protein HN018_26305 [Lichenicola cladoniae]
MTPIFYRSWVGRLRCHLVAGFQPIKSVTSAAFTTNRQFVQHQSSLEELLADDMIQAVMHADGVTPTTIRTLFSELKAKRAAGTIPAVKRRWHVFFHRMFNHFLSCRFQFGPNSPYLQGSLLVVSAAVVWLALLDLCFASPPPLAEYKRMLVYNGMVARAVQTGLGRLTDPGIDRGLAAFCGPTLVTFGARDSWLFPEAAARIVRLSRQARLSVYAAAGHSPFFWSAGRFDRELAAFAKSAVAA